MINFEKTEIDKMPRKNGLEPAQSEWASLTVFDSKDVLLRFWIDYRKWDVTKVKNAYPHVRKERFLDCLGGACILSRLDASSEKLQI